MELHSLLTTLSKQGIKLSTCEGLLEVDAPQGVMTSDLRHALSQHKAEIVRLLNQLPAAGEVNGSATELPTLVSDPSQRYAPFPLTDMQYAFWVGRSGVLELGTVANHGYYEIDGQNIELERLNQALQILIDRHDMLRAIILPDGRQQVLETLPPYQMPLVDLRGQSDDAVHSALAEIRDRLSHQVVPADQWPLFEFSATQLDGGRVRLHISYDLQVFDAWSLFRLFDEWVQLYKTPDVPLPPLELTFRDYVLAEQALQKTELYLRSQTYWLNRLDSLPPAPDLPLARHPKELKQHRAHRHEDHLQRSDWQQLKQRAMQAGITPSGLLLAAFADVISLWSQSPRFTINLALFNRLPLHPQVNDLLGDFTSVTLLAVDQSVPASFTERAARLQQQLWQDLEHRYFSGVRVVRELARRRGTAPSVMPIIFTSTLGFRSLGQETLTFSHFGERVYGISQASQAWMDMQVWEENEELTFNWDVVDGLFPDGLIDDMFSAYGRWLRHLARSASSWTESGQPLKRSSYGGVSRTLLPPDQQTQRALMNATDAPISDALLHELFATQVRLRPQAPAVITLQQTLTYQDLFARANQLEYHLRQMGVTPNQLVAIAMDKGWEQVVAVMGVLMAGAAYVPLDPHLPQSRLEALLDNSEAAIVLTQTRWLEQQVWPDRVHCLCVDDWSRDGSDFGFSILDFRSKSDGVDVNFDLAQVDQSKQSEHLEPLSSVQTADDLAYVIYTSGSTGTPKGVMISHRNVVNVITHTNQRFQVGEQDRMLALTALNHDLSVYDIFGLLSAGGAIVMPDVEAVKDPSHWLTLMARERVTLWNSVPAFMEMLIDEAEAQAINPLDSLRLTILGGDWLPLSLPDRLRAIAPNTQIFSIGGPTETTIWNIGYLIDTVDPNWASIPYGQPLANSKYYILNEILEDCPIWVPGQMYCAGVQLAKGYWRDKEKTNHQFITHPYTGERLYATGDLGRYRPNGTIEILGRIDFQIKLRGLRIEAGEVEAALLQHPAVQAAVVGGIGDHHPERLVAYVVPQSTAPSLEELRDFLAQKLPSHMVPSAFVFLETLPLSANGKVDRKALQAQAISVQSVNTAYVAPQNQLETAISTIFQTILDIPNVGIHDNFFDLGGNSLLLAKVYRALVEELPEETRSISLIDLFRYSSVQAIAQRLSQTTPDLELESQMVSRNQQLAQGKNRLKTRLEKSRNLR
ncbi:non-ribosomal peptide synthetase [Acaryochloris marina]|uniref:Barbamide biosynthesis protein BarG n=1 Tax=Acaryochloris marina (strain MBIC 11017) TaxID=329726 RepID=A8ZKN0_ACAM1|nr:non-ribosomal peptide synthetase [Acaryochloris marina]ABW31348.1 barbamide biosynthesis protein BarG [Acaryochloris marina MBIC11017]